MSKAIKSKRWVGGLKLGLILSSFFLVVGLIFWPSLEAFFLPSFHDSEQKKFYKKIKKHNIQSKEIFQPRFVSEDEKKRPYTVQAEKGLNQEGENIKLEKVIASMDLGEEKGDRLAITSKLGDVQLGKEGSADLEGQVIVSHNMDYTLYTDKAHINFEKGEIDTDQEIEGHGVYGAIHAQGLYMNSHEKKIYLKGKTKIRIETLEGDSDVY